KGFGKKLLARLDAFHKKGPKALSAEEKKVWRGWTKKMLERIGASAPDDALANFRRSELLVELLPLYFHWRRLWYPGPKQALAWLEEHDVTAFGLFRAAVRPFASPTAREA